GIAYLASHVRSRVPPAVREEDGDESERHARRPLIPEERREVRRPGARERDGDRAERCEGDDLRSGQRVLRPFSRAKAERVDGGQERHGEDRDRGLEPARSLPEERRRRAREPRCQRGDRSGEADPEARPAREKAQSWTVRFAEIDVFAAAARK